MTAPAPIAMLAELTHRCPLSCPYCSNPIALTQKQGELSTAAWADTFRQAADLGVLQLHLSGGEPLARRDIVDLVAAARDAGLYVNLITSAIGLTQERLGQLDAAGLDHVQLSLQGTDAEMADYIGGYRGGFVRKIQAAGWVRETGIPLTLNTVLHKKNMHQLPGAIDMALDMGARRIEVAIVQFHGWALRNRTTLMPTKEQADKAARIVADARTRLKGRLVLDFVPADYHTGVPKRCMGGWGMVGLNIAPDGKVLPCHAAETIPNLTFPNITQTPLRDIWYDSPAFNAYRGDDWMQEPCKSCAFKKRDFGGCRCQAMALAGDAAATDPTCHKSSLNAKVQALTAASSAAPEQPLVYRKI